MIVIGSSGTDNFILEIEGLGVVVEFDFVV